MSGGGAIFSVGKKDSDKLREIWDGSRVSQASVKPPPLPHLLTSDSLLHLECPPGQQLRLTKRDGETLFDSLAMFLSQKVFQTTWSDAWGLDRHRAHQHE